MPLLVPSKTIMGEFQFSEGSHTTTRPAAAFGTSITPGNNTFGTAVQVGADLTVEAWAILIGVNSINLSVNAKDSLTQIGFDFAGGTTFPASPDRYNSITLLTSCASPYNFTTSGAGVGILYYFPLRIPSGTAILARGSVNNATVGTQNVWWQTWGRPKYPEATRRGCYVESLGIVAGSSRGTVVTPGGASEGTAVSLGTLNSNAPCWYWEFGHGINDGSMSNAAIHNDLLMGSSSGPLILENGLVVSSTAESLTKAPSLMYNPIHEVAGGTEIFGRCQSSTTVDAEHNMAAYGVGG